MHFTYFLLQLFEVSHLITLGTAYIPVSGFVLGDSEIVGFEPVNNDRTPDLFAVEYSGMNHFELLHQAGKPIVHSGRTGAGKQ